MYKGIAIDQLNNISVHVARCCQPRKEVPKQEEPIHYYAELENLSPLNKVKAKLGIKIRSKKWLFRKR